MGVIEHLVIDTAGFIEKAPLQDYASNIYTIQEVINEVTNKRQKTDLSFLPYTLNISNVFPENIKFVVEFSKKTGDFPNLSVTDIKVIALTYQIHKDKYGTESLKIEPQSKSVVFDKPISNENKIIGFYDPDSVSDDISKLTLDEDDGWITENSLKHVLNNNKLRSEQDSRVGCVTTDYAIQNVLKQIGLAVIAIDGRVIKELRTYIRRCYGCFKLTTNMTRMFCPNCGNKTLKRVAVYLDENGKQCIYINEKRPINLKGKKFSLPKPQGGKHGVNPRLVEDQPMPHQRPSRLAKTKTNALDPDYTAGLSPFATRDVYSKSAMLCFKGSCQKQWMKRNPNEVNKKCKK
ncbi:RNA-binding protein NOB1 [Daktulosphaira vitifoliae]|uniref:RNA-binding protein NOB1 n=1 Tax=Daktulosphaira vitifoliae TaxID=58002 RepID=UPI0021AA17BA|nr:RNA-binding protein NOB1 [Daktulosphaira vitifoliae]